MADVNLLPQEERAQEKFLALLKKLQISAVGLLIVTAVATIIVLAFFLSLSSKRLELISQLEEGISRVERQKATEELVLVVRDKTAAAQGLLTSRIELVKIFTKLAQIVPGGVYFTDLRVAAGKLVISGKAASSADLAGLVSALVSGRGAEIVSGVTVDSLSADEAGIYSFVISSKIAGL